MDNDFSLRTRVVFVDDEPNVLNSMRRLFRGKAWEQLFLSSAEEALDALASVNGADVVVTDQRMPNMSGADLLRIVRYKYPWCARIVLSGYTDLPSVLEIINDGSAQRFLSKPWEDKVLLDVVTESVESIEIRRQNEYFRAIVNTKNIDLKVSDYFEEKKKDSDEVFVRSRMAMELLDAAPVGVVAASEAEIIEFANQAARRILGVSEEEPFEGAALTNEVKIRLDEKRIKEPKFISSEIWRGTMYTFS